MPSSNYSAQFHYCTIPIHFCKVFTKQTHVPKMPSILTGKRGRLGDTLVALRRTFCYRRHLYMDRPSLPPQNIIPMCKYLADPAKQVNNDLNVPEPGKQWSSRKVGHVMRIQKAHVFFGRYLSGYAFYPFWDCLYKRV